MIGLFSGLLVLLFPLLILAKPEIPQTLNKTYSNGEFVVYVQNNGEWEKAGSLPFGKNLTKEELSLSNYSGEGNKISVRILQTGGGAAHIDAVLLGGQPPRTIKNAGSNIKHKISKIDNDLIDAHAKEIDMVFDAKGADRTLTLAARIEALTISDVAFQFPTKNTGKPVDAASEFYSYRLNSERGSLKIDGNIAELANKKPFFKVYSNTGSGHPSGYTYGWVRNDDRNLYVAIDFTPDNTMDGQKDYAKVFINNGSEIKEYKVSVPEKRWGLAGFNYTDKVGYQHKVYEFKIPLSDIYDNANPKKDELLLAFAAYGTAGPGNIAISLQANPPTTQPFAYDTSWAGDFSIVDDDPNFFVTHTIYNVSAGSRTITQTITPAGYVLTSIECNVPGGQSSTQFDIDVPNKRVIITYDPSAGAWCTFLNQRTASVVPTMTEWGMLIFIILAGLASLYYIRRRSAN